MVGLTSKQQEDMNFAIYEYLVKQKYEESAFNFQKEAGVVTDGQTEASKSTGKMATPKNLLEIKWTSIARLKKENIEL